VSHTKFVRIHHAVEMYTIILLMAIGIDNITDMPRNWVDFHTNYPQYRFLVAVEDNSYHPTHQQDKWRVTEDRRFLIFPLIELIHVINGHSSDCAEVRLFVGCEISTHGWVFSALLKRHQCYDKPCAWTSSNHTRTC
jgi:hypothetical protein